MNRALDIFRNALWQLTEDEPRKRATPAFPADPLNSFFTFRYSYTEITAQGGAAHVKRRETRFENGRLVSEECEGTLDRAAYDRMAEQAQQVFIEQMNQAMKMFYLPFSSRWPRDE